MAEGLECEDAETLQAASLEREVVQALARVSSGTVECEVLPRGLVLEAHGVDAAELRELVNPVAARNRLVVFDPQTEPVTEAERREVEALADSAKVADERARRDAELPGLVSRAESGDGDALAELGNRYFFGEGVAADVERAFSFYLRAAEAGSDAGMVNVASCYRRGEGVPQAPGKAVEWYTKAMATDRTFAPFELGQMYEQGEGVAADREKSVEFYAIAMNGNHPDALRALRRLGALPPGPKAFVRP
jgi:hypothetical protein